MTNRLIQLVSSVFSKNSVDIKFKGAKLVLQPEFAVGTEVRDKDGKLLRVEDLQWRTEDGFTEIYAPEAWKEEYGLKEGQQFETPILAFRLPSTGLHSAIKVRIKGFYPVPEGTKANIVIAPRQIVFNHGSDYDIDSLFVLLQKKVKDVFKDGNYVKDGAVDLKDILKTVNEAIKTKGVPSVLLMDKFIPFSSSMKVVLEQAIESIREEASSILRDMPSMKKNNTWTDEMQNRLVLLTGNFGKEEQGLEFRLMSLYNASLQNRVIELFTDIISAPGNRELMEYPITMDVLSKASQKGQEDSALDVVARMRGFDRGELDGKQYADKRDELLYPKIDLSLLLHQRAIFRDVWSGAKLVGAAANFFKILAYTWTGAKVNMWKDQDGNEYTKEQLQQKDPAISRAIKEFAKEGIYLTASSKETPMLSKDLYITGLNGVIYDGLSHNERRAATEVEKYTDENGQEQEREIIKLVDNEIVVGYDNKKKTPITRVRKV
jgi:hypothetical protein